MTVSMIVAMTVDGIIGKDGKLPWSYPKDLKRFKQLTEGKTVIMGRKTWESLPAEYRPLPKRRNIVLSRRGGVKHVDVFKSLDEALASCNMAEVWIIGGRAVYAEAMKLAVLLDVTYVPDRVEGKNLVRFPPIYDAIWEQWGPVGHEFDEQLFRSQYKRRTLCL